MLQCRRFCSGLSVGMECFLNQVLLTLTIYWESKPRGTRAIGANRCASQSKRLFALTNANWSATTCRCVRAEGNTNMILYAIIGESEEVLESATIIGMLILCWAIYTVYTGGCSDL